MSTATNDDNWIIGSWLGTDTYNVAELNIFTASKLDPPLYFWKWYKNTTEETNDEKSVYKTKIPISTHPNDLV